MLKVIAQGKIFSCAPGENLRQVLLKNGVELYNGEAKIINCYGIGSCGTCAVQIEGDISLPNWRDKARRSLPPHKANRDLRLACQTQVLGDIAVTKYKGFWGQTSQVEWSES